MKCDKQLTNPYIPGMVILQQLTMNELDASDGFLPTSLRGMRMSEYLTLG